MQVALPDLFPAPHPQMVLEKLKSEYTIVEQRSPAVKPPLIAWGVFRHCDDEYTHESIKNLLVRVLCGHFNRDTWIGAFTAATAHDLQLYCPAHKHMTPSAPINIGTDTAMVVGMVAWFGNLNTIRQNRHHIYLNVINIHDIFGTEAIKSVMNEYQGDTHADMRWRNFHPGHLEDPVRTTVYPREEKTYSMVPPPPPPAVSSFEDENENEDTFFERILPFNAPTPTVDPLLLFPGTVENNHNHNHNVDSVPDVKRIVVREKAAVSAALPWYTHTRQNHSRVRHTGFWISRNRTTNTYNIKTCLYFSPSVHADHPPRVSVKDFYAAFGEKDHIENDGFRYNRPVDDKGTSMLANTHGNPYLYTMAMYKRLSATGFAYKVFPSAQFAHILAHVYYPDGKKETSSRFAALGRAAAYQTGNAHAVFVLDTSNLGAAVPVALVCELVDSNTTGPYLSSQKITLAEIHPSFPPPPPPPASQEAQEAQEIVLPDACTQNSVLFRNIIPSIKSTGIHRISLKITHSTLNPHQWFFCFQACDAPNPVTQIPVTVHHRRTRNTGTS